MLAKIESEIKQMGILAILRKKNIISKINVYQLDFLGVDEKYHSLLVMYDDVFIYGFNKNFIGDFNNDCIPSLEQYHKVFNTKEEWVENRYSDITIKTVDKFCQGLKLKTENITKGPFSLLGLRYGYSPVMLIVDYAYNGKQQRSLVLIPGQKTYCSNLYSKDEELFYDFLSEIGVINYVYFGRVLEVF